VKGDLIYISNTRVPSQKANTYQSFCVCEALAKQLSSVEFWHPARRNDYQDQSKISSDNLHSVFQNYSVSPIFTLRRMFCLDVPWLARVSERLWFLLEALSFAVSCLVALQTESTEKVILTRDSISLMCLALCKKIGLIKHRIFFEAHNYSSRQQKHSLLIDGIVSINSYLKRLYDPTGTKNILVAHDGVSLNTFGDTSNLLPSELLSGHTLPDNPLFVTYIGRFNTMGQDKGIHTIIESMPLFNRNNVVFLFIGGPIEQIEPFYEAMESIGVDRSRAIFLDRQPVSSLKNYMKISSALLMPFPFTPHYAYYMSPLKMFEYMTSRVPIIASRLPSIEEVLEDGYTAILCHPDDPQDLAEKIQWVIENDCTDIVRNAWQTVQEYTWDKRAERIVRWLNDMGAWKTQERVSQTTDAQVHNER